MKIQRISLINTQQRQNVENINNCKSYNTTCNLQHNTSFNGEQGQAIGAALGMFAGVAASLVVGPLAALAISTGGLFAGGFAGDKIEDSLLDKKDE